MQTYKSTRLTRTPHEKKKDNPSLLPLFQVRQNHTHTSKKETSSSSSCTPLPPPRKSSLRRCECKIRKRKESLQKYRWKRRLSTLKRYVASLFCDRFFRDAFYDLRAFVGTEARGAFLIRRWIRGRWFFFCNHHLGRARARGGVRAASFLRLIQRH